MSLLGAAEIRALAAQLDLKPSKSLGQNFVIDGNVCKKIVRVADVRSDDVALEIGPGLGSLTLALLEEASSVVAIEIDSRLATQLPITVAKHSQRAVALTVYTSDALAITSLTVEPTVLVANLPYNVSVPVFLHLLEYFPTLRSGVVMVQAEVADSLAAKPNSREYGIPSVKAAWWADVSGGDLSHDIFFGLPLMWIRSWSLSLVTPHLAMRCYGRKFLQSLIWPLHSAEKCFALPCRQSMVVLQQPKRTSSR